VSVPETLVEAGYALAIGLAVGFEREHHDLTRGLPPDEIPADRPPAEPAQPAALGARTFALVALAGWLAAYLGDRYPALAAIGVLAIVAMIGVQYALMVRAGAAAPGITTEVAAVAVALLGVLVHVDRAIAVPLSLAVILLLVSKPWTRGAMVRLRRLEITATVQLLVLAAIVLPMLPAEPVDPWDAIPPRKVGLFVVLIAAVEYVGYVLHRVFGTRRGTGLAGLVGGLASSTAVTAAMARTARERDDMIEPAQLGTFLANAVMAIRVTVVTAVLSPTVAWRVAPAMGGMVVVLLIAALVRYRKGGGDSSGSAIGLRNPFALVPALTWGAILCAVLLGAHFATEYLGDRGMLLAAGAAGLADVDAITLAASRQASDGTLTAEVAALAIAIAVAANTVVKGGIAVVGGGRRFGAGVALVFGIALGVAVAAAAANVVIWG
jgi:uncharacterized membrane protein (DUF4010 family)